MALCVQPLTEVTTHQKTRDAGGDSCSILTATVPAYQQTTEAELMYLACVNWHSSTWTSSGFGLFCHLLDSANLFCVTHVIVEGLQLCLPGGKVLLGQSRKRLPVPKPICAKPSLPFVYFLSDNLQCYWGAERGRAGADNFSWNNSACSMIRFSALLQGCCL